MRGSSGIVHGCRDKELRQRSGGFAAGGRVLGLREDGRLQRCCGLLVQNQRRNLICFLLPLSPSSTNLVLLQPSHGPERLDQSVWTGASGPERLDRSVWIGASGPERPDRSIRTGASGSERLDRSVWTGASGPERLDRSSRITVSGPESNRWMKACPSPGNKDGHSAAAVN